MLKLIRLGGLVGALLLLAPVAVKAQSETLEPSRQIIAQQEISSLEFNQFVQALLQLRTIEREAQQEMVQEIEKVGLSPQRFQEIGESLQKSGSASAAQIPEAEFEKFQKALAKMREIVEATQPKRERAITSQGLEIQRFNEIGQQVQQDPTLQQRVRERLGN